MYAAGAAAVASENICIARQTETETENCFNDNVNQVVAHSEQNLYFITIRSSVMWPSSS